jgi:hypothetical protein
LAIPKQDVCMVFFNDMDRVSPLPHPEQRGYSKKCRKGLCRPAPPSSRQGNCSDRATSLRKYDKRRWKRPVQPSTPKPRGRPQNPQAFCGDGVGIAWRRRVKYPLDRLHSVLVRRYGLSLTLSALFSASLGPRAHFVRFPNCNTPTTTSVLVGSITNRRY